MFIHTFIRTYIWTYVCTLSTYVRTCTIQYCVAFCGALNLLRSQTFSFASASSLSLPALLLYATDLLLVHYCYIQSCIQFSILIYLKFMLRRVMFFSFCNPTFILYYKFMFCVRFGAFYCNSLLSVSLLSLFSYELEQQTLLVPHHFMHLYTSLVLI